jgi:hypothetical protein
MHKAARNLRAWRYIIQAYASNSSIRGATDATHAPCRASSPAGKPKRESRSELKPEFHATEHLIERWAQQAYDRAPTRVSTVYIAMREAAGLPLPSDPPRMEDDVLLLDTQVFAKADPSVKHFCEVWYCQGGSIAQKAARMAISREALYCQRKIQIEYIRDRLRALGLDI